MGVAVRRLNNVCRILGTGAYHAAVEIYGKEWSYGACQGVSTGVFWCEPRNCGMHSYREPIQLGHSSMTQQEVKDLLTRLSEEWLGWRYDVLRNNCCHFSDAFAKELGVGGVPGWVMGLAGVGARVEDALGPAMERIDTTITRGKERRGAPHSRYNIGDFSRGIRAIGEEE